MRVIKRNAIRCKKCGDIIESYTTHDFQTCSCGACSVDGGHDYCKISGDAGFWESLIETEEVPGYVITAKTNYGSEYTFRTVNNYMDLVKRHEAMWEHITVYSEDGDLLYETPTYKKERG